MSEAMVGNEVLRKKFEWLERREGLTLAEVAERIGWITRAKTGRKPDSSRVGRTLGVARENGKARTQISVENALKLADALHVDPVEMGL